MASEVSSSNYNKQFRLFLLREMTVQTVVFNSCLSHYLAIIS